MSLSRRLRRIERLERTARTKVPDHAAYDRAFDKLMACGGDEEAWLAWTTPAEREAFRTLGLAEMANSIQRERAQLEARGVTEEQPGTQNEPALGSNGDEMDDFALKVATSRYGPPPIPPKKRVLEWWETEDGVPPTSEPCAASK